MRVGKAAVASLEQTLGQGTVDAAALAEAQRLVAAEAAKPLLVYGTRGERASLHRLLSNYEAGLIDWPREMLSGPGPDLSGSVRFAVEGRTTDHMHAWILDYYSQAVEAARLPPHLLRARWRELDARLASAPLLVREFVGPAARVVERYLRFRAALDCATAGLAVERFRLECGRWPASLDEAVAAGYLDRVPLDAPDGQPLRYHLTPDGAVVYSVDLGGQYAGDALGGAADGRTVRPEFRLWNVEQRRQPPPEDEDG